MSIINDEDSLVMTDHINNKKNYSVLVKTINSNSDTNLEDDDFFDINSSDESLERNLDEYDENKNNCISNFFIDAILKEAKKQVQKVSEIKQTQSNLRHIQTNSDYLQYNKNVTFSVFDSFVSEGIAKIGEIKQKTFESYEKVTKEKIRIIKEIKEEAFYKIKQVKNEAYLKIKSKTSNEIESIIQSEIIRIETVQYDALSKIKNTQNEALIKIQNIKQESLKKINDVKIETLSKIDFL